MNLTLGNPLFIALWLREKGLSWKHKANKWLPFHKNTWNLRNSTAWACWESVRSQSAQRIYCLLIKEQWLMFLPSGGFVGTMTETKSRFLSDNDLNSLPATLTGLILQGAARKAQTRCESQSSWMFGGFLLGTVILSEGTEERRAGARGVCQITELFKLSRPLAALPPPRILTHFTVWAEQRLKLASVCFHCSLQLPCLSIICKGWAPSGIEGAYGSGVSKGRTRSLAFLLPLVFRPTELPQVTSPYYLSLALLPAPVLPALLLAALLMAFISHLVIYSRLHSGFYTHLTQVFILKNDCCELTRKWKRSKLSVCCCFLREFRNYCIFNLNSCLWICH